MGLWSKGLERAQTGEWRKEDGTNIDFVDDTCHFITQSWGSTCKWEHQVTPIGQFCFISLGDDYQMSFSFDKHMSKEHILSEIMRGMNNLEKKVLDYILKNKLSKLTIDLSFRMINL